MRASDVPIDDLRRKYQADPGSLTLDEYEALSKVKKLISTPAASVPAAAKSRGKKLTKTQKKANRRASAARQRELREPNEKLLERIFKKSLVDIANRQDVDGRLSVADVKIMAEISKAEAIGKSLAATREIVQGSLEKQIQLAREEAFYTALIVMRTSKSGAERLNAAVFVKEWSDAEAPAEEPYVLAAANPGSEKNEPGKPGEG